ncbi:MAG: MFS transporter [Coriobacteriia bacterium]|nr:MFS transporter [Coriobacteriia bacterium]MBS5477181.1 MFS transporter [Coriobacteriia bacterium]
MVQDERVSGAGQAAGEQLTLRMLLPLIGLTFSAFVFNTSEFMPIGLLTDIAADLAVSEGVAGMIITVYAWAVMLLSLPLMMAASRFEYRTLLIAVVIVFAVGQALAFFSTGFAMLLVARLVVACAHAVFWSITTPMAVSVVSPRYQSLAIGMVSAGTSIAMILGMPLGRAVGLALGWRMAFGCVGVIAVVIAVYLRLVFPKLKAGEPFTLAKLPVLLSNRVLVGIYVLVALFATAYYTGYSYIEPFLQQVALMDEGTITAMLTGFGAAGIVGSLLYARFYDGHRRLFILGSLAGIMVPLLVLLPAAKLGVGAVLVVCVIWGMCATAFNVAFQGVMVGITTTETAAVAMSIYSGIFNLGIGLGTAIGGGVSSAASVSLIGFVGGAIALAALAFCATWLLPRLDAARKARS